jgi:hypothetical protein
VTTAYGSRSGYNTTRRTVATQATINHEKKIHRWVLEQLEPGGNTFRIYSAVDGKFVGGGLILVEERSRAGNWKIDDLGNGKGYRIAGDDGFHLCINQGIVQKSGVECTLEVFSVTYASG